MVVLYDHCNVITDNFCYQGTHYQLWTRIHWLLYYTLLTVIVYFQLKYFDCSSYYQYWNCSNNKSNCKWMIKFSNQIVVSPIFYRMSIQTLIDNILSHQLPIFFLYELNPPNTVYHIYVILNKMSFEVISFQTHLTH